VVRTVLPGDNFFRVQVPKGQTAIATARLSSGATSWGFGKMYAPIHPCLTRELRYAFAFGFGFRKRGSLSSAESRTKRPREPFQRSRAYMVLHVVDSAGTCKPAHCRKIGSTRRMRRGR
jgi:hypothetical protein